MHAETESTVTSLVPGLLEAAGMPAEAEEMRRVDMFSSTCVHDCTLLLRRVSEESRGPWGKLLQEVCFWAEAMLWMAWDGDGEMFYACRESLDKAVSDGLASMACH